MAKRIIELAVNVYITNVNDREITENPSSSEIVEAVRSLDGKTISSMAIIDSEENVLAIGGGPEHYNVSLTDDTRCYTIVNKKKSSNIVKLIIGGVTTPLPEKYLVDLETAIDLAKRFHDGQFLLKSGQWE